MFMKLILKFIFSAANIKIIIVSSVCEVNENSYTTRSLV